MIGHDITAALPELQAQANSLMTDACEIRLADTQGPYDPDTNTHPVVAGELVYAGRCRVRHMDQETQVARIAEQQVSVADYRVTVPWAVAGVKVDLRVKITASSDPDLVDQRLTVVGIGKGSLRIQRVLLCTFNEG